MVFDDFTDQSNDFGFPNCSFFEWQAYMTGISSGISSMPQKKLIEYQVRSPVPVDQFGELELENIDQDNYITGEINNTDGLTIRHFGKKGYSFSCNITCGATVDPLINFGKPFIDLKYDTILRWVVTLSILLISSCFISTNAQECVERRPISVAIALDVSGSMAGNIVHARNFATGLVNGLNATGNLAEVEIFLFNGSVPACAGTCGEFIWGSPSNATTWVSGLNDSHAGGGTALYQAAFVGARITRARNASNLKLFVLVTDGDDDGSSIVTPLDAVNELSGGSLISRLIFIGTSATGAETLNTMADAVGPNSHALNSTPADLINLISEIVGATCVNHRPVADFSISDSNLELGIEGFTIDFNGSSSNDVETSSADLGYSWIFTRPDGSTFTRTSRSFTETFNDDQLNIGTNWQVSLRVRDASNVSSNQRTQNFSVTGSPPDITLSSSPSSPFDANVTATLEASPDDDIDGGQLSFNWTVLNGPDAGVSPSPLDTRVIPLSSQEENITTYSDDTDFRTPWHFQCTATDDEGETDTEEITIRIKNLPPRIIFFGDEEIDVNFPIRVGSDVLEDDDGGFLTFQWDIIQAPNSSPVGVQNNFSTSSDFDLPTTDEFAGTWRLRLTATDNELEEYNDVYTVFVDGPPVANISGPMTAIGSLTGFPLTLDGSGSIDTDSRDDLPDFGHSTSDPPVTGITPGIVSYSWSLIDAPLDNPDVIGFGRVDEVLGIDGGSPSMTIPFSSRLSPGYYTFLLEVEDYEGNFDTGEFQIEVVEQESKPISTILPPFTSISMDPSTNTLANDISLFGSFSFDPDNFLVTPLTQGITSYSWGITQYPSTCPTVPFLPSGSGLDAVTLFNAGTLIPLPCQGLWKVELEVTDDDAVPKISDPRAEAVILIGNCPSNLCIDLPTNANPDRIQFTEDTDVMIYFHLNAVLYSDPAALLGTIARLEIIHESDPTPFYTKEDPNLLATDQGGYLVFHWNGYSNTLDRPKPGRYHVNINLADPNRATSIGGDAQLNAIFIEVADPEILPTSDTYINRNELIAGTDQVDFNYSITGGGAPDELVWRIFDDAHVLVIEERITSPPDMGSFSWDGNNTVPAIVPSGKYYVELETFFTGNSMGKSTKSKFTLYNCDIDADTNRDGVIDDTADDANEDTWSAASGAIFNVNYDRDGARTSGPLPINDVLFINDSGQPTLEDKDIENGADAMDITPFVIRKIMDDIPGSMKVFLVAGSLEDIQSVHVFKKIAAGETAIWGELGTRAGGAAVPLEIDITDYVNPTSLTFQGDPVTEDCTFGLEGLFFRNTGTINTFDGVVDFRLEVRQGGAILSSDAISLKVAPYLMVSHNQTSSEIWVIDDVLNKEMRETVHADPSYFALEFSVQMKEVTGPSAATQWFQDHLEIGYYQRPGGTKDHCVFRLPYFRSPVLDQPTWPQLSLLTGGVAEFQLGKRLTPTGGAGDYGGNVEIIPPNAINKNGRVVIGSSRTDELFTFFQSQEVQDPIVVNTKWLSVSHVDEVFGFTESPNEMILADPSDAYALMNAIPAADRGKSVFFATGATNPMSGTASAPSVAGNRLNSGIDHRGGPAWGFVRIIEDSGSGATGQVARIVSLEDGFIEIDKVWNIGSAVLPKSPPPGVTTYGKWVLNSHEAANSPTWFNNPDVGDKYVLVEGTRVWSNGTPAFITVEEILADTELENLNLVDIQTEITSIKTDIETANGTPMTIIKVPTIYFGDRVGFTSNRSCVALTPGLANFQRVNGKFYFPRQFGPRNAAGQDIFETTTLGRVPDALFTDDWILYHALEGEVHCGTNVKRVLPLFNWWAP